tara:strand:- start:435 stop:1010 length:576 start_codon:yes stop_codon:yes gene_type:complete
MSKIPLDFFLNHNVQEIARDLLGAVIYTQINNKISSAIITETEAYQGPEDKASHAYNNNKTNRTKIMYQDGGCCYIYLCYGIHHLFNIVTNTSKIPHAVLIRSGKINSGLKHIKKRRKINIDNAKLLNGPGNFAKGLGIDMNLNGQYLNNQSIWIEPSTIYKKKVKEAPRIGIDYAAEYASRPWRYILQNF